MAEYPYDARAYEERYRRVYEAGAEFWEKPVPTQVLVDFLSKVRRPRGLNVIEFGCGEGRDSIFLAKSGCNVTGVDTSRSALGRAKQRAGKEKVDIALLLADVVNLPVNDETFELAVNVGCLNLMTVQHTRDRHLLESSRVLKRGGTYFSCNSVVDQSTSIKEFYEDLGKQPGTLTSRKIRVHGKEEEILLPIIAAWPKSKEQYLEEFERAGYKVVEVDRVDSKHAGECWVLVARKER